MDVELNENIGEKMFKYRLNLWHIFLQLFKMYIVLKYDLDGNVSQD